MSQSEVPTTSTAHVETVQEGETVPLTLKERILQLQATRTATEASLKDNLEYLAATPVGMDEPLVDEEGFPRSDCDLYAVREARQKVRCARNDLQKIQDDLFDLLNELHGENQAEAQAQMALDEQKRRQGREAAEAKQKLMQDIQTHTRLASFLAVAGVEANSPAELGGLRRGQRIVQYGDLTAETWPSRGMAAMGEITRAHENVVLSVWVKDSSEADEEARELSIVPQKWTGVGLLGCSFDPL